MKKFAWSAVSLALSAIAAYVFLLDRSQPPEAADALRPVQQAEPSRIAPDTRTSPTGQGAAIIPDPVVRTTRTVGDLKVSRFKGGDIGYLDVDSIIKNDDPYSIVALLQEHRDLTGADESLDLEIRFTRDYPAGKSVSFRQLINGKPTKGGGKGSLTFDPASGAVKSGYSSLLNPQPANAMSAFILRDEAVAIARAAAVRFAEPYMRPGDRLSISAEPKELRYALDTETDKLRLEWPVWVSFSGFTGHPPGITPGISREFLVAADTGEIVGANNLVQPSAASAKCSDLAFRVCDASLMTKNDQVCGVGVHYVVKPVADAHRQAATIRNRAKGIINDIKSANKDYLGNARGTDCTVDILISTPKKLMETVQNRRAAGQYDSANDQILLQADEVDIAKRTVTSHATQAVIVHEVMHAVSQTSSGDVEHGLVSAAEALHMGGTDHRWKYGDKDFTTKPEDFADMHVTVAHAMYRIYKKIGDKDKAFRFVLAVDEEMPESDEVAETFLEVAEKSNMATEVTEVLTDMGLIQANYNFFADEYEDPIDKAEDLWSWYLEWLEEWLEDELHEEL